MNNQILNDTQKWVIEKLPIASTLRALEIGKTVFYPKSQYDSLYAASRRLKDVEEIEVKITRTKERIEVKRIK